MGVMSVMMFTYSNGIGCVMVTTMAMLMEMVFSE